MNFNINDIGRELSDVCPSHGWHCSHFFYRFDRRQLASLELSQIEAGCQQWNQLLDPSTDDAPSRMQIGLVSGHKADFSLMIMDPDPIRVESIHQELMAGPLGVAIEPTFSYVSFSEISEYVQSVEQYAKRLTRDGDDPKSSAFETKLKAYADRQERMNYQRLTPNFPDWPVSCFYPMNKWRYPGANWFSLPFSERNRLMAEHARSGIKFAGKVTQLITVGIGLDDWEWGVTLWATNPEHLKQIVYDMRFDKASAKYAEFGPFYTSYQCSANQLLEACRVIQK